MRISDWSSDVCSSDLGRVEWRSTVSDPISKLSWDDLRIIRAVGKNGALAPAAETLGVNSSTLARRLSKIGRASCRERVWQYVSISVVAVSLKKKIDEL